MKRSHCLVAALIFLFVSLQACATAVEPLCSHRALYQAISFNELTGWPVRIAVGPSDLGTHLQAQAQRPDGKWEWLEQGDFGVGVGYKDRVRGFEAKQYITVEQLLQELGYVMTKRVPARADNEIMTSGDYSFSRRMYRDPLIDDTWRRTDWGSWHK